MRLPDGDGVPRNGTDKSLKNGSKITPPAPGQPSNTTIFNTNINGRTSDRLPIEFVRSELVNVIRENDTLIVMGETGSGKSTRLPQYVIDARLFDSAIAVTQPRRIAAISIAKRVADERNVKLGSEVGYSVRFEEQTSNQTKLKYLTDGMLLREAQSDPSLKRYGCIILDEAHERTIHTDVLFGIIKNAQRRRMLKSGEAKLKVIIMSATMDVDHFSKYFNCKVVYLEGRTFPINVRYALEDYDDYTGAAISTVLSLHSRLPLIEHFLVFLTGQDEIDAACKILKEQLSQDEKIKKTQKMEILPLYAALSQSQQLKVFKPAKEGTRRVIVTTNIAETSLTIPGVRHVIDTGRVKQKKYHPATGMQLLKVCWCSKAQSWQRAGRAGREASGNVYRLYTESQFGKLNDSTIPEIQRSPLANVCLQLLNANVKNLSTFEFIDAPPAESVRKALEELCLLGLITRSVNTDSNSSQSNYELTPLGIRAARFPLEPRLTKALLVAQELKCAEECITIAALLSAESIYLFPPKKREEAKEAHRKFHSADGDLISMLNVFKAYLKAGKNQRWCYDNYLQHRHLDNVYDIRKQLREIFLSLQMPLVSCDKPETIRKAFARGMFMNCAQLKPDGRYQEFGQNLELKIHPSSVLFGSKPGFIMFNELCETNSLYARSIFIAEPEWAFEACPTWFKTRRMNLE